MVYPLRISHKFTQTGDFLDTAVSERVSCSALKATTMYLAWDLGPASLQLLQGTVVTILIRIQMRCGRLWQEIVNAHVHMSERQDDALNRFARTNGLRYTPGRAAEHYAKEQDRARVAPQPAHAKSRSPPKRRNHRAMARGAAGCSRR